MRDDDLITITATRIQWEIAKVRGSRVSLMLMILPDLDAAPVSDMPTTYPAVYAGLYRDGQLIAKRPDAGDLWRACYKKGLIGASQLVDSDASEDELIARHGLERV